MPVAIPESAVCKQCRYRLFGLPNPICPECGLYYITGEYINSSGGIMLGTFGQDLANRRGFVYSPDRNWYDATPLGDGWWLRTRW